MHQLDPKDHGSCEVTASFSFTKRHSGLPNTEYVLKTKERNCTRCHAKQVCVNQHGPVTIPGGSCYYWSHFTDPEMRPREVESLTQGHTVLSGRAGIHTKAGIDFRRKGSPSGHQIQ